MTHTPDVVGELCTYTVTLEDDDAFTELVFLAPTDDAAVVLASGWGTVNGWPKGTRWECRRFYPLTVDLAGKVTDAAMTVVLDEGVTQ